MKKTLLATTLVLALVFCFSASVFCLNMDTFDDVNEGDWYAEMVNVLHNDGIINGYEDNTFRPSNEITRAEFATIAYYLFLYYEDESFYERFPHSETTFIDVNEGDWFYDPVMALASYDVANGYSDGTFRPNAPITREEIAFLIYRMISSTGPLAEVPEDAYIFYPDVLAGRWSEDAINFLTYIGAVNGYPNGTFKPEAKATRAEAVAFLYFFANEDD
jgi:hypothetical protein